MPSILQKVQPLLQANLSQLIDRAIKSKSMQVIHEYIRQLERNLEALKESSETVAGSVRALKRKYEEFSAQAKTLDRDVDTLILRTKDELPIADDRPWLHTKAELAQEYYEQWQAQEKQLQDMQAVQEHLKQRLSYIQQVSDTIQSMIDSDEPISDDVLESLLAQADTENERIQTGFDEIEDTKGIRRVELQLEERKRRLLRRDSDDDNE